MIVGEDAANVDNAVDGIYIALGVIGGDNGNEYEDDEYMLIATDDYLHFLYYHYLHFLQF